MKNLTPKKLINSILIANLTLFPLSYANAHDPNQPNGFPQVGTTIKKIGQTVDDITITAMIKSQYIDSPFLNPLKIKVDTDNGVVRLSGTVGSDAQYARAIQIAAAMQGVADVTVADLKVAKNKQPLKDIYLTAKVKGRLIRNGTMSKDVQNWPIKISSKDGVVTLTGTIKNKDQENKIINAIKAVKGVTQVKSKLKTEGSWRIFG